MRVLYVDDNAVNRLVVSEMLKAAGIAMDEAEDGETGLRMFDEGAYHLVLMDLRMPGMDGAAAIRRLRARGDEKAKTPIIVVTGDASPTVAAECRAAGADDLIMKPVALAELYGAIERIMAPAARRRALRA